MGVNVGVHSGTIGEMTNQNNNSLLNGGGKENTGDSINIAT